MGQHWMGCASLTEGLSLINKHYPDVFIQKSSTEVLWSGLHKPALPYAK